MVLVHETNVVNDGRTLENAVTAGPNNGTRSTIVRSLIDNRYHAETASLQNGALTRSIFEVTEGTGLRSRDDHEVGHGVFSPLVNFPATSVRVLYVQE